MMRRRVSGLIAVLSVLQPVAEFILHFAVMM